MSIYLNENVPNIQQVNTINQPDGTAKVVNFRAKEVENIDKFESSTNPPPEISTWRLMFNYLTKDQVNQVNESGKLPPNAKFMPNGVGGYSVGNNFFGLRAGTRRIPEGFELKRNLFGFTIVVPKETEGLFIK